MWQLYISLSFTHVAAKYILPVPLTPIDFGCFSHSHLTHHSLHSCILKVVWCTHYPLSMGIYSSACIQTHTHTYLSHYSSSTSTHTLFFCIFTCFHHAPSSSYYYPPHASSLFPWMCALISYILEACHWLFHGIIAVA